MRTFKITLWASLASWLVGILAGNVGGLILTMTFYGPQGTWTALTISNWLAMELTWAFMVAIGMLPCSALLVAPLTFRQLGKTARWGSLLASVVGGAGGIVGVVVWLAVLALFGQPVNWARQDDRAVVTMITVTAFLIGATTGGVAAWLARVYPEAATTPATPAAASAPPSYDY